MAVAPGGEVSVAAASGFLAVLRRLRWAARGSVRS